MPGGKNDCIRLHNASRNGYLRTGNMDEFYHQVTVPQNEVSTFLRVEGPKGGYRAPPKWQVGEVGVFEADGPWAKVVSGCGKDAGGEIAFERGFMLV